MASNFKWILNDTSGRFDCWCFSLDAQLLVFSLILSRSSPVSLCMRCHLHHLWKPFNFYAIPICVLFSHFMCILTMHLHARKPRGAEKKNMSLVWSMGLSNGVKNVITVNIYGHNNCAFFCFIRFIITPIGRVQFVVRIHLQRQTHSVHKLQKHEHFMARWELAWYSKSITNSKYKAIEMHKCHNHRWEFTKKKLCSICMNKRSEIEKKELKRIERNVWKCIVHFWFIAKWRKNKRNFGLYEILKWNYFTCGLSLESI